MTQYTEIAVHIVHETDRALLVDGGFGQVWVPKSQITSWTANTITLPEWLAKKKRLI